MVRKALQYNKHIYINEYAMAVFWIVVQNIVTDHAYEVILGNVIATHNAKNYIVTRTT